MKTLYIDCGMGAAGDMLTAALLELAGDKDGRIAELNAIGIPGVEFSVEESVKHDVTGSHVEVKVNGEVEKASHDHHHEHEHHHDHEHTHTHTHSHDGMGEHCHSHEHTHSHEHDHDHNHSHDHEHHHVHRNLADVHEIIKGLNLDEDVRNEVIAVYDILAAAESKAHDAPVAEVHFHEVGMMDAIADITAVCYLMKAIGPEKVVSTPVHAGNGTVKCAHGILPVPAPATENILKDTNVPYYLADVMSELCTPTGAALISHFTDEYCSREASVAEMAGEGAAVGHGMGFKDFVEAPNCVTVYYEV